MMNGWVLNIEYNSPCTISCVCRSDHAHDSTLTLFYKACTTMSLTRLAFAFQVSILGISNEYFGQVEIV